MNRDTKTKTIDDIFNRFSVQGHRHYGEEVTELEHALQAAWLASLDSEPPSLVAACLLHDFGHLLHDLGERIADIGIDARHEEIGADKLSASFPAAVVEPIRLHVAAKRYLCRHDTSYLESISDASRLSLTLQGGPMTEKESIRFEGSEFYREAIRLRRYDDAAKIQNQPTPQLETYRAVLESLLI